MRVAVADHISDTFLDTLVPLMLLVEAAQDGNQKEVEECAIVFTESAAKLEEVSCTVFLSIQKCCVLRFPPRWLTLDLAHVLEKKKIVMFHLILQFKSKLLNRRIRRFRFDREKLRL